MLDERERKRRDGTRGDATALPAICALLRAPTGHDFSQLQGRARWCAASSAGCRCCRSTSVDGLRRALRAGRQEVDALFRDLLIGVTHFFRDPEAFEALARAGDPASCSSDARRRRRRCASGCRAAPPARRPTRSRSCCSEGCCAPERARRGADLRHRHRRRRRSRSRAQRALSRQRSRRRLARAARALLHQARTAPIAVAKELREMCVFSHHNLIKDPPFSRLDLSLPEPADLPRAPTLQQRCPDSSTTRCGPAASCSSGPPRASPDGRAVPHGRQEAPHLPPSPGRAEAPAEVPDHRRARADPVLGPDGQAAARTGSRLARAVERCSRPMARPTWSSTIATRSSAPRRAPAGISSSAAALPTSTC